MFETPEGYRNLHDTCDRLDEAKQHSQDQNNSCNPERVPLHFLPPIKPPLFDTCGFGVIVSLLQDDKAIPPVVVFLYVTWRCTIQTSGAGIQIVYLLGILEPSSASQVCGRKQKSKGVECFFQKPLREDFAITIVRPRDMLGSWLGA